MDRYLVYDSMCTRCNTIAENIQQAAKSRVTAISIYDDQARELLKRCYPEGWQHAPYLIEVDKGTVKAWTGMTGCIKLGMLMGPLNSLYIWRLAWKGKKDKEDPGFTNRKSLGISRRVFLKVSGGVIAATTIMLGNTEKAEASSNWCDACGATQHVDCECYDQTIWPCNKWCNPYVLTDRLVTWECYKDSGQYCTRHSELMCNNC